MCWNTMHTYITRGLHTDNSELLNFQDVIWWESIFVSPNVVFNNCNFVLSLPSVHWFVWIMHTIVWSVHRRSHGVIFFTLPFLAVTLSFIDPLEIELNAINFCTYNEGPLTSTIFCQVPQVLHAFLLTSAILPPGCGPIPNSETAAGHKMYGCSHFAVIAPFEIASVRIDMHP